MDDHCDNIRLICRGIDGVNVAALSCAWTTSEIGEGASVRGLQCQIPQDAVGPRRQCVGRGAAALRGGGGGATAVGSGPTTLPM
jgi:hypothetical protein